MNAVDRIMPKLSSWVASCLGLPTADSIFEGKNRTAKQRMVITAPAEPVSGVVWRINRKAGESWAEVRRVVQQGIVQETWTVTLEHSFLVTLLEATSYFETGHLSANDEL